MAYATIPRGIDRAIVDETVASGFPLLKFPTRLETAFEQETGRQRCRQLAMRGLIGMLVYDLLLIADWWVTSDIFLFALSVRIGVVDTSVLLIAAWVYFLYPPAFVREQLVVFCNVVLAGGMHLYLMLASTSPHRGSQHEVIVVIIFFMTLALRTRFWHAVPACLVCCVMHAAALRELTDYPFDSQLVANLVIACTVIISLFASYVLERETRGNYLLSLRERLQSRELGTMSRRDALTGLCNRRALSETLTEYEETACGQEDFSVVLLDVDYFKKLNDMAGHQAGDLCLKRIAGMIQSELRDLADHAFRYGGEEFLIVLSGIDLLTACGVAERIRCTIETAQIPHPGLPPDGVVTASLGVASAKLCPKLRVTEIIAHADAALYKSKHNGRNQIWPRFSSVTIVPIAEVPDHRSLSRADSAEFLISP